jgi:prepilin-type N-terminal cleavage/methylation domain-containing protein
MRNRQEGFSLIELLVVVAIILIIAAIAIPNLLSSRMSANEASAAGSLRTYTTAMLAYSAQCENVGFPNDLTGLGPGAGDCTGMGIVDELLGGSVTPSKNGYAFTYVVVAGVVTNDGYTLNADPQSRGTTGRRSFYTDQTGVIYYNQSAPASPTDPALQ